MGGIGGSPGGEDHPELTPEERFEARSAAHAKLAQATAWEPAISDTVREAVEANGGRLERFDCRLKALDSLYRKVQDIMVDDETTAADAASEIRDSLRYTAVVDEAGYWDRGNQIGAALAQAGYTPAKKSTGWRRFGYKGRNDTFISADGLEFEVQIHTAASLEAAERAHTLYERERLPTTPPEVKEQLRCLQDEIFAAVPAPDDVKWVD